ncbi:hypothetical protein M8C21_018553 [Ambrosia artemisiifolia]|uniref:Uncharacterized protein n=1 Tax=Ambrosia artemisiifolia TaxID=4212 RepID=A0AAD5CTC2_AMBAR|nr:hypothetical protein M8C21_018553 [Ambrosia artemisiifolia]
MAKPIDQVHAPTVVKQDHNDRFIRGHLQPIVLIIFPLLFASIAGMIYLHKENKSLWNKNEAVIGLLLFLVSRQIATADEEEDSLVFSFFTDTFYFSALLAGGLLFVTALCEGRAAVAMRWSITAFVVVIIVVCLLIHKSSNSNSDNDNDSRSIV